MNNEIARNNILAWSNGEWAWMPMIDSDAAHRFVEMLNGKMGVGMNNDWFDLATVKPRENASIWLWNGKKSIFTQSSDRRDLQAWQSMGCTHWQYAVVPEPPKSQCSEDSRACEQWMDQRSVHTHMKQMAILSWHAALKWERTRVMNNKPIC